MWYYAVNDQQLGPISQAELQQKLRSELAADTLVWKDGMASWTQANELTEFSSQQGSPPPITPAQSTNPYATPTSYGAPVESSQDYPFPEVKRANFALLATLKIVGLMCIIGGYFFLIFETISSTQSTMRDYENRRMLEASHSSEAATDDHLANLDDPNKYSADSAYEDQYLSGPEADSTSFTVSGLIILAGFLIFGIGSIIGLIYIYRAWKILQPSGVSTTPGQAVGFLFIPLFNFYWIFIAYRKWAEEWNSVTRQHSSLSLAPKGSEGVFLAMAICQCSTIITSFLGMAAAGVLNLVGMKSMCNVINYAADQNSKDPSP